LLLFVPNVAVYVLPLCSVSVANILIPINSHFLLSNKSSYLRTLDISAASLYLFGCLINNRSLQPGQRTGYIHYKYESLNGGGTF